MSTPPELSAAELQRIFDEDIRPYYFPDNQPIATRPTIVLVGGQPGSGKSNATPRLIKERPGIIPLSGDDLRAFHSHYEQLMEAGPLTAGPTLAQATAVWVRMAIEHARDTRRSLLLEGTFHTPQVTLDTAAQYRRAGFSTELVALATPRMDSLLSAAGRYFASHQASRDPRWTTLAAHERGWQGTREILTQITPEGPIDAVAVINRAGTLYRAEIDDYEPDKATDALDEGRSTPITNRAAAAWLAELRAFTLYARASHQFNTATAPVLDELHTIALRDVVPSMNLPQGSEAAARLTERLTALQAEITAAQTPTPTADPQPPAPAPTTTGPTLD